MTADPPPPAPDGPATDRHRGRRLGSLGTRMLVSFVVVALSSVVVLTIAALLGTDQGLASAQRAQRQRTAERAAQAAATAYAHAGGWAGADLTPAAAIATAAGAQLVVHDATGTVIGSAQPRGSGSGTGKGRHASPDASGAAARPSASTAPRPGASGASAGPAHGLGGITAPVTVDGRSVGDVRLSYGVAVTEGRQVAWNWVIAASIVALAMALAVAWFVTRSLTRPLNALAATARAFARGDRAARANLRTRGEIGDVGTALDHLADEVVEAEAVRRHLAADVAHELRTPLAALQAGLEELRDGLVDPDPARLAALHDQALRLGRIVGDLAELSAAEAAALSLRRTDVDLADLAEQALTARRAELRAAGLTVTAELARPLPVHADADRIHQAIGNLLANSARYCRPGDSVSVRTARDGDHAVVEIGDTGPGIAPEDLPHVFERLRRGRTSHSVAGSGIGLAVVRELVAAHGGTVTAASTPDAGATFTIRIPVAGIRRAGAGATTRRAAADAT